MNEKIKAAMREAAKLTQTGQVQAATEKLQRTLRGSFQQQSSGADKVRVAVEKLAHALPEAARQKASQGARSFGDFTPDLQGFQTQPRAASPAALGQGQFLTDTYTNSAGTRPYKLYIPKGVKEDQPLPLVVMLHGCTQDPDDFAAGTQMNLRADEEPRLVLYPAQTKGANANGCWNWFQESDQRCDAGEPSIIAGMTREVMRRYSVHPKCVYVAGLSAGGAMAAIMGEAYPELFAAVCVHSGLPHGAAKDLPSALMAMQRGCGEGVASTNSVPTIVFHGDRDNTVSPRNGEAVLRGLSANRRYKKEVEQGQAEGGRPYTRTRYLDAQGRTRLEGWRVHGAGHAWAGGSSAGTFTDPKGPDATRAMLAFFRAASRS